MLEVTNIDSIDVVKINSGNLTFCSIYSVVSIQWPETSLRYLNFCSASILQIVKVIRNFAKYL